MHSELQTRESQQCSAMWSHCLYRPALGTVRPWSLRMHPILPGSTGSAWLQRAYHPFLCELASVCYSVDSAGQLQCFATTPVTTFPQILHAKLLVLLACCSVCTRNDSLRTNCQPANAPVAGLASKRVTTARARVRSVRRNTNLRDASRSMLASRLGVCTRTPAPRLLREVGAPGSARCPLRQSVSSLRQSVDAAREIGITRRQHLSVYGQNRAGCSQANAAGTPR